MSVANLKPLIPGQTWLTGIGAPNPQFGYKTQFYLDTVTGTIYQKTDTLVWSVAGTMNPSGDAPVKSVNGEIGFVVLDAADVGAIPTSEKGAVNGVASLDGTGKVPTSQLPASTAPVTSVNGDIGAVVLDAADVGAIPTSDKGIANGVASLDATGKVPTSQLPPSPGAPVLSVNGLIGDVVLTSANVGAVAKAGDTMTGVLTMGPVSTGAGETGQIAFKELAANGIYSVTLRAPNELADYVVLTLPTTHGTTNQVLTTDGTGVLSWTSPGGTVAGTLSHPTTGSTFELGTNSLSVGTYTTAIGVSSGINSSGVRNSLYGAWSGRLLTTGTDNTAIGSFALNKATTSSDTTALGSYSLRSLETNNGNTAVGYASGQFLTSGSNNLFINSWGSDSYFSASGNNIIGKDSNGTQALIPVDANMNDWFVLGTQYHKYYMPGVFRSDIVLAEKPNSAGLGELRFRELDANGTNYVGFKAASSIASNRMWTLPAADGTNNQVLTTNGSGILSWTSPGGAVAGTLSHPTSDSTFELNANNPSMTGIENTFIGVRSGYQITTGFRNTGLGLEALRLLTTGSNNTALGNEALRLLTTGSFNTAIGYQSLQQLNGSSGGNVAIGYGSGQYFTNSSNNTFINSAGSSGAIDGALGNFFAGVGSVFPEEAISGSDYQNWFVLGRSVNKYVLPGKVSSRLVLDRFVESGTYYGGTLSFEGTNGGSNKISFSAPFSIPSNVNYTLPASDGSNTQVLTTNGSGVLSWQTPSVSVSGTLSHPTSYSTVELGKQPFMVGTYNTIIGEGTAGNIQNAAYNTFFGVEIAVGVFTGNGNSVVGGYAGSGMSTAAYNSLFGNSAGYRLSKGEENVLVGLWAAENLGSNVVSNFESFGNVIVGARAASFLNKGNYNLVLGANSGVIFNNSVSPNNYNTIINCEGGGPQTADISGCVLIGRDSSGSGPVLAGSTTQQNQFILGTENHSYHMPGTFYSPIKLGPPDFNGRIVFTGFGTASTITLEAPNSITSSVVYKLPSADGTAGQSLKTDGAGNLYWG
jgi:hypothetical protein